MARWKALSKGFPMVPGAVFVGGRVPVVLRLTRRPMTHWKAFSKGFPTVAGACFVDGRLGSVSMHCEWARVPVVFRLSGRPRVFWRAWLSVVLTLVWLPVQH
eukprot:scaffold1567_cov106-Isochrysis_galbana.AAC.2